MFSIFSKKFELIAPASGKTIALENVPDPVFAQKTLGDGIAIDQLTSDIICAPADGLLEMVFRTNHAFAIRTKDDVEILVHIGINTVELEGKGFERLMEQGQQVNVGDPIIRVNRQFVIEQGLSLATPIVITSPDKISELSQYAEQNVISGEDVILTYKKK